MDDCQKISDCIRDLQAIMDEKGDLPICLCTAEDGEVMLQFDHQFDWIEAESPDGEIAVCAFANWVELEGPMLSIVPK